jgi:GNAT superfamily N-acetyltransferase
MNGTYEISTDPSRLDISAIHSYLTQSYWSPGIPVSVVEKAIANSLCFGAYLNSAQIGFARVITDRATFGYLADVFVLESHRGNGVAHKIMEAIIAHPELQGLRRIVLATRDAHGLYTKYGFTQLAAPSRFMEMHRPNAYGVA